MAQGASMDAVILGKSNGGKNARPDVQTDGRLKRRSPGRRFLLAEGRVPRPFGPRSWATIDFEDDRLPRSKQNETGGQNNGR